MNDQIQLLLESWDKLKKYIPAKDRPDAAIDYVNMIDEYGAIDQDWKEIFSHSNHLRDAYTEVFGDPEEDDLYDDDEYNENY